MDQTEPHKSSFEAETELRETAGYVSVADVIKHALAFHKKCSGKGWTGTKDDPVLCPCAVKRFLRENRASVVQIDATNWSWLKGRGPAAEAEQAAAEMIAVAG